MYYLFLFTFYDFIVSVTFQNLSQIMSYHSLNLTSANASIFSYKMPICKDERISRFYGDLSENQIITACKNLQYDFFEDIDFYNCSNKICSGVAECSYDYENNFVNCGASPGYMGYFLTFDNVTYLNMAKNVSQDLLKYINSNYSNISITDVQEFSSLLNLASIFFPFTQYSYLNDMPQLIDLCNFMHNLLISSSISKTSTLIISYVEMFLSNVINNFGTVIDYTDYILTFLPDSLTFDKVYTKISLSIYEPTFASDTYLNFSSNTNNTGVELINKNSISYFSSFIFGGSNYINPNYTQNTPFVYIPRSVTQTFSKVKYIVIQIKDPRIYITRGSPGIKSQLVLVKAIGESKQELNWPNNPEAIRIIIPWAFPPFVMKSGYDFMNNCRVHLFDKVSNSWTQVFGIIDPNSNQYYVIIYVNNFGLFGVSCTNNQKATLKNSLTYLISNSFSLIFLFILIIIL